MDNNYFTTVNPYFTQSDQGLSPVFQNIAGQQQNQNMAIQQGQQMAQQVAESGQQGGGMNPMAMAAMLRGKPQGDNSMFGARMDMALNSKASPYLKNQVSQLGSSTANPFSDYNMGTNGWGNYGE